MHKGSRDMGQKAGQTETQEPKPPGIRRLSHRGSWWHSCRFILTTRSARSTCVACVPSAMAASLRLARCLTPSSCSYIMIRITQPGTSAISQSVGHGP